MGFLEGFERVPSLVLVDETGFKRVQSSTCQVRSNSKFVIFGFDPTLIVQNYKHVVVKIQWKYFLKLPKFHLPGEILSGLMMPKISFEIFLKSNTYYIPSRLKWKMILANDFGQSKKIRDEMIFPPFHFKSRTLYIYIVLPTYFLEFQTCYLICKFFSPFLWLHGILPNIKPGFFVPLKHYNWYK